jgi:hypothetical protein
MKINCLETAKKTYKDQLDNADIESTYKALVRQQKMLEADQANVMQEMNNFSKDLADKNERANKEKLLQQLMQAQAIVDSLQREELFRQAGHAPQNSVFRSMQSKMAGTSWKVARNKDNTYNRQGQATDGFTREFASDIQGELTPLFTSKTGQKDLATAMYEHRAGRPSDTPYGRLAAVIIKYQDRMYDKLRAVGVDITELEDRIAPNVHNAEKMLKLSRAEKRAAREEYPDSANPEYEFALQRWNRTILPLVDEDKTFRARNVDPQDAKQVDEFQRKAFDNLVNKGKVSQEGTNFANKFKQERVYHWKDGSSLVDYNNEYGNEAIQDSIIRELSNGFGMVEVMKDWGVNPDDTIRKILKVMDENPVVNQRLGKAKEAKKLLDIMASMTQKQYADSNAISSIVNYGLAYEAVTKLGNALAPSLGDLRNTGYVARQLGRNRLEVYGGVIKNMVVGMSDAEKKVLAKYVNNGISTKLGQVNRYYINPWSPKSWQGQAMHWIYKLNLLERWDNANKGYVASVVGQYLADHRHITWDAMTEADKAILGEYNISAENWELIRQSSVSVAKQGKYIMPDTIQQLSDDMVRESLIRQGVENPSAVRIQMEKDAIERKTATFFRDRQEHSITTPDAVDRNMLTFGITPDRVVAYNALRIALQFKHFGIALFRKSVLPVLREKGATTGMEMLFGGKANWKGMGLMGAELMALSYIGATLTNLALGKSPPSLDKMATWTKMLRGTIGSLELAFNIHPTDLAGTIGRTVIGPLGTDIEKISRLITNAAIETNNGKPYKKTKQSAYQLLRNGIPFNTIITKWLINHIFLDGFEDWAYPGKRQKDLRQVKKDTGAVQLF